MAIKGVIATVLLALLAYGFVEARHLLGGPSIHLDSPSNYTSSTDGYIHINGVAANTEALFLNGGALPIDEEGRFTDTVLLPSGSGILSLTATDRFGRSATVRRTIHVP
jgi:hypothetical protein